MKISLLALAGLSAFAGNVSAQSNVTVYGILDIGYSAVRSDTVATRIRQDSSIQQGSRLGFRGTEALGAGLTAEFILENGFNVDTGEAGQGGRIFGRQAYVGLSGAFGSIKFGRQWMPSYVVVNNVDPFGVALAGDASAYFGTNIYGDIDIRMDNAINYAYATGGFSAVVTLGLGEVANNASAKRQMGFSTAYERGPLDLELGYHQVKNSAGDGSAQSTILGGVYDFGAAKAHLAYGLDTTDEAGVRIYDKRDILAGFTIPAARGTVLVSYIHQSDRLSAHAAVSQYAFGYTHPLSKRSNLYTSFGHASLNRVNTYNLGIRHIF